MSRNNISIIIFIIINIASFAISDDLHHRYVSINNYISILGGELFNTRSTFYEIIFMLLLSLFFYRLLSMKMKQAIRIVVIVIGILMSIPIVSLYGL